MFQQLQMSNRFAVSENALFAVCGRCISKKC